MNDHSDYEYVAVELPPGSARKGYDRALTEAINRVAVHGWRLHTVTATTPGQAIFERVKQ